MITGSTYFTAAIGIVVGVLIARHLGPDDYGRYAYLVWLAGVAVLFANNGLTVTGIRFISEAIGRMEPGQAAAMHRWVLVRQIVCITAVAIVLTALLPWLLPTGWSFGAATFLVLVLVAAASKSVYLFQISVGKGYGQYAVEAYTVVTLSAVNLVGVGILYFIDAGLMMFCVWFVAIGVAHLIMSIALVRHFGIRSARAKPPAELLARVRPHLFWSVVLALVSIMADKTIETWMLNRYVSAADVGYFVIAASLTRGAVDIASAGLDAVLMPMMSHGYGAGGKQKVESMLADGVRYYLFLGVIVAGLGFFLASPIIQILYGEDFSPAILAFQLIAVIAGLTLAEGAIGALFTTTDNQRLRATFVTVSLLASVLAAVALIPPYGLMGAVAAHGIARFALLAAGIIMVQRISSTGLPWRRLGTVILTGLTASVAGYAAFWLLKHWTGEFAWVLGAAVFQIVYLLGIRAGRFWQPRECQVLNQQMDAARDRLPDIILPLYKPVKWYFRMR